jgi:hypothetical protein
VTVSGVVNGSYGDGAFEIANVAHRRVEPAGRIELDDEQSVTTALGVAH